MEIIHSDVCQITESNTLDKEKYFVIFVDDKSRYTTVSLLKTKDQVFDKFISYMRLIERQTGKLMEIVRSDNGGEYCSNKFSRLFQADWD